MKKIIVIPSNQGCLGKNVGCEDGGKVVCKMAGIEFEIAEISESDFIETTKKLEKLEGDVFVGGDHSITYPLFKNSDADGLIIFDAHADCVNNFSPPTHEDFVRVLVEEKIVSPDKILIIGLRNVDPIEKEYLKDKKINHLYMNKINDNLNKKISEFLQKLDNVYLSIDIDSLDGEKYVGTGYPEKDGFDLEQLKESIKNIMKSGKVIRSDLVEINPSLDKNNLTVNAGSEILRVILGNRNV
ncbi:MAG TPA: arginase family protein [Candidatus Pacearchaeota archaeon]|jgi:arginase|nr:arginase family protein [Candidatus Pacearchaeota archaeon]|tara:strand:- start:262 stop:987 length:726 start_codon:yes stop_codon:yes gene_type:complete